MHYGIMHLGTAIIIYPNIGSLIDQMKCGPFYVCIHFHLPVHATNSQFTAPPLPEVARKICSSISKRPSFEDGRHGQRGVIQVAVYRGEIQSL